MKKSMSALKRLLAMMLVFAMVVGYMPVGVFAEEADIDTGDNTKATGVMKLVVDTFVNYEDEPEVPETPEDPEIPEDAPVVPETPEDPEIPEDAPVVPETPETPEAPTEPELPELPEVSDDPIGDPVEPISEDAGPVISGYTYSAYVIVDDLDTKAEADEVEFLWDNEVAGDQLETEKASVTIEATYKGITLYAVVNGTDGHKEVKPEAQIEGDVVAYRGCNAPEFTLTSKSVKEGSVWTTVWNESYVAEDIVIADVTATAVQVAAVELIGEDGAVYASVPVYATVENVPYTAEILTNDDVVLGSQNYNDAVNAYVAVKPQMTIADARYLDVTVKVGDVAHTFENWNNVSGTWKSDCFNVEESCAVSVCTSNDSVIASADVTIDSVNPDITNCYAYHNGEFTNVRVEFQTGITGATVTVMDAANKTNAVSNYFSGNDSALFTIDKADAVEIKVVGGSGLETKTSINEIQDNLAVDFILPEAPAAVNDITYINEGNSIEIRVINADDALYNKESAVVKDLSGAEIAAEWKYADGVWSAVIPVTTEFNGAMSVVFVDALNRSVEAKNEKVFSVDTAAPVIEISEIDEINTYEGVMYVNHDFDYEIKISDKNLLADGIELIYTKNDEEYIIPGSDFGVVFDGESDTYTYIISMQDGDSLTGVSVSATDNTDNGSAAQALAELTVKVDTTAPVITGTLSDNVTHLYQNANGMFAVIDESMGKDVSITLSISDDNLDTAAVSAYMEANAWTLKDNTWTKTLVVADHETGAMNFAFMAKDLAGWSSESAVALQLSTVDSNGVVNSLSVQCDASCNYDVELKLDRRAPGNGPTSEAPKIDLTLDELTGLQVNKTQYGDKEIDRYNMAPSFNLTVNDYSTDKNDSGLKSVAWSVKDENGVVQANGYEEAFGDDQMTFETDIVTSAIENGESNAAVLEIAVYDYAGNIYNFTKFFGVDNKKPVIVTEFSGDEATNGYYYNGNVVFNADFSDLNLDTVQVLINGVEQEVNVEGTSATFAHTFEAEGEYEIKAVAKDVFGYTTEYTSGKFIIDLTAAVVEVEYACGDSNEANEFRNEEVTYKVNISDKYLSREVRSGDVQIAELVYSIEDAAGITDYTVALTGNNVIEWNDSYSYQFTLRNGQILRGMTLRAVDNAGNTMTEVLGNVAFENQGDVWTYAGQEIVVDNKAPEIDVTKSENPAVNSQEIDGVVYDYYDADVTYNIQISDAVLDIGTGSVEAVVTYMDGAADVIEMTLQDNSGSVLAPDVYEGMLVIDGSKVVKGIEIKAVDNSGNESSWSYDGNPIVVDKEGPKANLKFSDNVASFYIKDNTVFAILKEPVVGDSGEASGMDEQTVSVTIEVTDYNILVGETITAVDKNDRHDFAWTGETSVNAESTVTYVAEDMVRADGTSVFYVDVNIADLAGHKLTEENLYVESAPDGTMPGIGVEMDNGRIKFAVSIDRQRPSSFVDREAPEIAVTPSIVPTQTASGLDLFNGAFTFALNVTDGVEPAANGQENAYLHSGVKYVKWSITDSNRVVESYESGEQLNNDGLYTIDVPMVVEIGETNDVVLHIEAVDHVGNTIQYTKTFGVDNLAPRVSVVYDNNKVHSSKYFNAPRRVEITVKDINYNFMAIDTLGEEYHVTENTVTYKYDVDGDYTLNIATTDLANNEAVIDYTNNQQNAAPTVFTVDMTAPEVKFDIKGNLRASSDGAVDYYSSDVVLTLSVTDLEINDKTEAIAWIEFDVQNIKSSDVEPSTYHINLFEQDSSLGEDDRTETYSHAQPIADLLGEGDILTDIRVCVRDNATNLPEYIIVPENNAGFECNDEGIWTYSGDDITQDTEAPVITVTKTVDGERKAPAQDNVSVDGAVYDYYDAPVTYDITVDDVFLTPGIGKAEVVVSYLDGSETIIYMSEQIMAADLDEEQGSGYEHDRYSASFTVEDGMVVTGITMNIIDNAGNTYAEVDDNTNNLTVTDADGLTSFEYDETNAVWNYTGNRVVCDTTIPEVTLEFSDNVKDFFQKGNTVYVIFDDPVVEDSGMEVTDDGKEVTVTVKVTDKNLSLEDGEYLVTNNIDNSAFIWQVDGSADNKLNVNEDATLTLVGRTDPAKVSADGTAYFELDLTVIDMAGNPAVTFDSVCNTEYEGKALNVEVDEDGRFNYIFSVDRLRPSSGLEDVAAPTIEVTTEESVAVYTSSNNRDLYAAPFHFDVNITDGKNDNNNSGIQSVTVEITDDKGVVKEVDVEYKDFDVVTYAGSYEIPVEMANGLGESNEVILKITAVDNVGNTIRFVKEFAFDTLKPRVTIDQAVKDPSNEMYFNKDQTLTIQVADINFDPVTADDGATTQIVSAEIESNSNVSGSGWTLVNEDDGIWTNVYTYNVDGHYTFEMQAADLAQNLNNEVDYTNGGANKAVTEFVIDKTAPVITVTYTPANSVDVDGNAVQYFNEERSLSVTIEEHNFNAADVQSDLGANNALSPWYSVGDIHTATERFGEGNNYSVKVDYTDLANNPAESYVSPTFSVDLTNPTIEVSKGTLTTDVLNIVPDDLLLGFAINDAQENLKHYDISVMFLDCNYRLTEVTGAEYYTVSDQNDRTNVYIDFTNIASVKANDGIYTIRINATDYAGHTVSLSPNMLISLNRFGSTFNVVEGSYTSNFLTVGESGVVYHQDVAQDLVVKEINPNRVWKNAEKTEEGSSITVSVNGNAVELVEGTDYILSCEEKGEGSKKWYEYTYTIKANVFESNGEQVDGEYTIFFYSVDDAENMNTNEANEDSALLATGAGEHSGKINFTLDHRKPIVTILGIEEGTNYFEENKSVEIDISDNTPVVIEVYVNGELVEMVETAAGNAVSSDWIYYDGATGTYKLNLSAKDVPQNIRVRVTDAADNTLDVDINDVMLTKDLWAQYVNSLPAQLASGVIGIALIILIIALIKKRKK